jgi:tripartite motif-containing protein 71
MRHRRTGFWSAMLGIAIIIVTIALAEDDSKSLQAKFLFSFGKEGEAPGQLRHPLGISADPNGNIYVADTGNNRIQKFDSQGRLLASVGGFGWGQEQFQKPVDLCAENGLDVFVADYENRRIERYDKELNCISSYLPDANLPDRLQFGFPRSVGISIHGDLFIIDSENRRVLKLNSQHEPETSFGDYDWGEGNLGEPVQVCVSRTDKVFVSDDRLELVMVYDYFGNFLDSIGDKSVSSPAGLCISADNILYVADPDKDQIVAFDPEGRPLATIGSQGEKLGAFNNPNDVALYQNRLYVADTDNHRIQVFELSLSGTP